MRRIDDSHLQAVAGLANALNELNLDAVLIGGVAVSLGSHPRSTQDVDALVMFDTAMISDLLGTLQRHGFVPLFRDAAAVAVATRVAPLRHTSSGIRVDIALGCMPFEQEVVDRRSASIEVEVDLPLATPEDLIILKSIASRPKDLEDIRNIALAHPELDRERVKRWVTAYGELQDESDLWERTEKLLDGQ